MLWGGAHRIKSSWGWCGNEKGAGHVTLSPCTSWFSALGAPPAQHWPPSLLPRAKIAAFQLRLHSTSPYTFFLTWICKGRLVEVGSKALPYCHVAEEQQSCQSCWDWKVLGLSGCIWSRNREWEQTCVWWIWQPMNSPLYLLSLYNYSNGSHWHCPAEEELHGFAGHCRHFLMHKRRWDSWVQPSPCPYQQAPVWLLPSNSWEIRAGSEQELLAVMQRASVVKQRLKLKQGAYEWGAEHFGLAWCTSTALQDTCVIFQIDEAVTKPAVTPPKQFPMTVLKGNRKIKHWSVWRSASGSFQCLQGRELGRGGVRWVKVQRRILKYMSHPWERWICKHWVKEHEEGGGLGGGVDSRKGFIS